MEKEKRVEILGIDDKRQITAVLWQPQDGNFLPIQVIYKGKTKRSLPNVEFPSDWIPKTIGQTNKQQKNIFIKYYFLQARRIKFAQQLPSTCGI